MIGCNDVCALWIALHRQDEDEDVRGGFDGRKSAEVDRRSIGKGTPPHAVARQRRAARARARLRKRRSLLVPCQLDKSRSRIGGNDDVRVENRSREDDAIALCANLVQVLTLLAERNANGKSCRRRQIERFDNYYRR